ncbi:MAG: hypothetical protein AB1598_02780 [Thermodesulfobacteriota bacterium]
MSESPYSAIRIHVSQIDEFLASRYIEAGGGPLAFSVSGEGGEGNISLTPVAADTVPEGGEGVDFELSACECGGLGADEAAVYVGRPVYTSSAYVLFDFLIGHFRSFDCSVEFTGNAWKVTAVNAADNVRS